MTVPDPQRVADLFARACDLPPEDQEAFLSSECGEDETLRRELDALLRSDRGDGPLPRKQARDVESASDPRLGQAVELWLRHLSEPGGESDEEFLQRNDVLRHYLEPLIANHAVSLSAILGRAGADGGAQGTPTPSLDEYLEKLNRHASREFPFAVVGAVDEGGMGQILRVWDEDLRRHIAMKVIKEKEEQGKALPTRPAVLARFLDEALVTGQLDHPGVVPVHRLGIDADGRIFFTMRLVRGTSLERTLPLVHAGEAGWTLTRAIEVMIKVCDTLAYAHSKKVVHRDLKPSNIMLGRFGEVYVVDWGIAKIIGREDTHGLEMSQALTTILNHVDEQGGKVVDGASPHMSYDGMVVGTPAYMAPEQARGQIRDVGTRTDVYAVGAILYEILTGAAPYTESGGSASSRTVLEAVKLGPPRPVDSFERKTAPELCAIVEKAMAREIGERYTTIQDVARDLRAFTENRVVQAHRTGAWVELRKWMWRHRGTAWTAGVLTGVLVVATALFVTWLGASEARAQEEKGRAERLADLEKTAADKLRVAAALTELSNLRNEAEQELWPLREGSREALRNWLERARQLVGQLDKFTSQWSAPVRTVEPEAERSQKNLELLVQELTVFGNEDFEARFQPTIGSVLWRLEEMDRIDDGSWKSEEARAAWARAIDEIPRSNVYGAYPIKRIWGLRPLGPDPDSGLWEFAHLPSGPAAVRIPGQPLVLADESSLRDENGCGGARGVVLVLIPAGQFTMGSMDEPLAPEFEDSPRPSVNEMPAHAMNLWVYFMAKHEVSQGQWKSWTGKTPSHYGLKIGRYEEGDAEINWKHPVECVSWEEASRTLHRLGLQLPTEAQWERAARADTQTDFWDGAFVEAFDRLPTFANVADATAKEWMQDWGNDGPSDGFAFHAPIDTLRPNGFGLHHVHGNVAEWCRDDFEGYTTTSSPSTGQRIPRGGVGSTRYRVVRGGDYKNLAINARSASRHNVALQNVQSEIGLRASLDLVP